MSQPKTPPPLSAKDPSSFAYPTMKDRIPVILSKIVDHLTRNKLHITKEYGGEAAREELKAVIGAISELRHDVMTNKPAKPLRDSRHDAPLWNAQLEKQLNLKREEDEMHRTEQVKGEGLRWFDDAWLWMECYLYRRVQEAFLMCTLLKDFDVFAQQKQDAFKNAFQSTSHLTMYLQEVINRFKEQVPEAEVKEYFVEFLQVSLWGNKCDLSISAGQVQSHDHNPVIHLKVLKHKLLIDESDAVYQILRKVFDTKGKPAQVDIVLDNAGFELVTDLCLAEFLITSGLASQIVFHAKSIPWFVSDVTLADWDWTLNTMSRMNHIAISELCERWRAYLEANTWTVELHDFWTMPNSYNEMHKVSPDLYACLSQSDLILFKGDLNYRKLVSDRQWDTTTKFESALRGFHPAPLCSLRTLKCDCVVGLRSGQVQEAEEEDENWMINGDWAIISTCEHRET
ncbi:chromosome 6 open reading frame 211 [Plakobranchus ocellatus]|uniref:Sugar phosphate phosphatase n=1 Tax=Plakobranchus ocellatus TaxID=259542 RepID=A0AAV3YL24_9GAST|nr:chromosome 6 open reading frame 211 [Plakobranchus ocellatus]